MRRAGRTEGRDLSPRQQSYDQLFVNPNGLGLHFREDWWLLPEHLDGYPRVINTETQVENTLVIAATISVFDHPELYDLKDLPDDLFTNASSGIHIDDAVRGLSLRNDEGEVVCTTITMSDGGTMINRITPTQTHQAISSYLAGSGQSVVHIVSGTYHALGTPFEGQTGMETRITRPFDGPHKWVGKLIPKP